MTVHRRLKIAMFLDAFPVLSETFIINQITGLIDRGHVVRIFSLEQRKLEQLHAVIEEYNLLEQVIYCNRAPSSKFAALSECISTLVSHPRWLGFKGLSSLTRIALAKTGMWGRLAQFRIATAQMQLGEFDIVHCQYGGLGQRVLPLVRSHVINGTLLTSFRGHDLTQRGRYTPEFYAELFEYGTCFMPVSNNLKERLIELGCAEDKISVVRSGINCANFSPQSRHLAPSQTVKLVTVARFVEMKGLAYSIAAVAKLLQQGIPVDYQIIGYGPLQAELETLISKLGATDHIHLRAGMAHELLIKELSDSHIFIAPSVTAENGETEGIPNTVKEAMAQAMPVLATHHSGLPELVSDGQSGYLVPERDVDALYEKLLYLVEHSEEWPELGRVGRRIVTQQYDTDVVGEALVSCYLRSMC